LGTQSIFAQAKELSLEEAILGRFSGLSPERLSNLQWVPDGSKISWRSKDRDKILVRRPGTRAMTQEVSTAEINTALQLQMKRAPGISWLDASQFYFRSGPAYYAYNMASKSGKQLLTLPEGAGNVDYHAKSNHAAFTKQHNLYIVDNTGKEKAVTQGDDPNIVSGQSTDESGLNNNVYCVNFKNGKSEKISKEKGIHSYQLSPKGDALIDSVSNSKMQSIEI